MRACQLEHIGDVQVSAEIRSLPCNGDAFTQSSAQFNACDAALKAASNVKQQAFIRFKRAEALYWMDQFGQALADVNLAIEADPDLIPAYIRRAWIYVFLGQKSEAGRDIE